MKSLYCLQVTPALSLAKAWDLLERLGVDILYCSEEDEKIEFFIELDSIDFLAKHKWIKSCTPYNIPSIDWEAQWQAYSHNFYDGAAHIDLAIYRKGSPILKLIPGPGFGDLSHPTTRLMLQLLAKNLEHQPVIDIGAGSGVLSLAAKAMQAPSACGIEIDPLALEHARKNAALNAIEVPYFNLEGFSWTVLPNSVLILMNMIKSEQQIAWNSLPSLHAQAGLLITSGIRKEEKQDYLLISHSWGWTLKEEYEEGEWLAFCFQKGLNG